VIGQVSPLPAKKGFFLATEFQVREIYDRLYSHAVANYSKDGWDFFVECCSFDDLCQRSAEVGFSTYEEAFEYYADVYGVMNERRADVMAEIF
jgi:hypothetical protein